MAIQVIPVAREGRKENSQGLSATARTPWALAQPNPRTPLGCEDNCDPCNQGLLASLAHPWLFSFRPSGATLLDSAAFRPPVMR